MSSAVPITIREAAEADLPAIDAIYDHYVLSSTCTFQTVPSSPAERAAWFAAHDDAHPVTVATDERGEVIGWGCLSVWNPRQAYAKTVEDSVYVHPQKQRMGIGRALLADLLARGEALGHHSVIAVVTDGQDASIAIHRALGFELRGTLSQMGWKMGRWIDVHYLQKRLGAGW